MAFTIINTHHPSEVATTARVGNNTDSKVRPSKEVTTSSEMSWSKKKVRFASDCQIHQLDEDSSLPMSSWYTQEEYCQLRKRLRQESQVFRFAGLDALLSFCGVDATTEKRLNAWCLQEREGDMVARGLEKQVSRRHREECNNVVGNSIYHVFSLQQRLQRHHATVQQREQSLCQVYTAVTREAVVFARRLGLSDELAVIVQGQRGDDDLQREILQSKSLKPRLDDLLLLQQRATTPAATTTSSTPSTTVTAPPSQIQASPQEVVKRKHQHERRPSAAKGLLQRSTHPDQQYEVSARLA